VGAANGGKKEGRPSPGVKTHAKRTSSVGGCKERKRNDRLANKRSAEGGGSVGNSVDQKESAEREETDQGGLPR